RIAGKDVCTTMTWGRNFLEPRRLGGSVKAAMARRDLTEGFCMNPWNFRVPRRFGGRVIAATARTVFMEGFWINPRKALDPRYFCGRLKAATLRTRGTGPA